MSIFNYFKNLMADYSFSTVVTFACTLTEYLIFWRLNMNKFNHLNRLITISEARCISKAARLLAKDDKYDDLFFSTCASMCKGTTTQVALGNHHVLVKTQIPATQVVARVVDTTQSDTIQGGKF